MRRATLALATLCLLSSCTSPAADDPDGGEGTAEDGGNEDEAAESETGDSPDMAVEPFVFGLVTVVRYAADATGAPATVELAAGLREEPFEGIEDLASVVHLQTTFAPPTGELDESDLAPFAAPFDFGAPARWHEAGTGIVLRPAVDPVEGETITGCLKRIGRFDAFPVYATGSDAVPDACRHDLHEMAEDVDYELVVFGGDLFDDEVAPAGLRSPETLSVSAPDLGELGLQVPVDEDLNLEWSASGADPVDGVEYRMVIRVWDEDGSIVTARVEDDGAYSISSEALQGLSVGPATITLARETIATADLAVGEVVVVLRDEHWGYLELY